MKKIIAIGILLLCCGILHAQTLPSYVPTDGLVAYYGFDGNADDQSGNGNNGTLEALEGTAPTFGNDRFGNANSACVFGGLYNPNYVAVANSASLHFDTAMSISFWMQQNTSAGGNRDDCSASYVADGAYATLISKGAASTCGGDPGLLITNMYSGTTQSYYYFNNNSTEYTETMFASGNYKCYAHNEWVHCVMVHNNGRISIYINGVLMMSERPTPNVPTFDQANLHDLYFGIAEGNGYGIYPYNGSLDDIAIYNRALSDAEVSSLFADYTDPNSAEASISMASVDVVNPCGNNLGTITLNPNAIAGVTYRYSGTSLQDLQTNNVISGGPGTYTCYVASSCRQWDTTITLVCDCADDPTYTDYQTICEGVSGQTGDQYESITSSNFDSGTEGWTSAGYWSRDTGESNFSYLGLPYAYFHAHSGSFAFFCSNLQSNSTATYFPTTNSAIVSPAINISYDPSLYPVTASFWCYATGFGSSNGGAYYNTLRLLYSTSPSGPWTQVWSISGGGHGDWEQHTVPLSSYITASGTYYFRLECEGAGYSAGFDDFSITADTRWIIPSEVSAASAGDTIRTEKTREAEGTCPITDITFWTILGKPSYDTASACDSLYWMGAMRYDNTNLDEQRQTISVATVNNTTCDSIIHHSLIIYRSDAANVQHVSACDSFEVFGTTYYSSADIRHINTTDEGCESIDSVYLTINKVSTYDTSISSCNAISWRGMTFDETADYADTLTSFHNCDSIITLHFVRSHNSVVNITDSFCENTSYRFVGRTLTTGGEYDAHMTDKAGCDSIIHLTLNMIRRPVVKVGYTLDCLKKEYTLWGFSDKGIHSWQCYPNDTTLAEHAEDDTLYLVDRENYTYIYTAQLDHAPFCPTTKEVLIPHIVETEAIFNVQPSYLSLDNLNLMAIDASPCDGTRYWYVDGVEQRSHSDFMSYQADPEADSVLVSLIIVNGNCRDTSSQLIPIIRNSIYVPNVFMPLLPSNNTATSNSRFRAQGSGIYDFEMHIYNRQGQMVFHSTDINEEWDGRYRGEYCPQGGYSYIIRYRDHITPGNYQIVKGVVTLLN